MNLYTSFLVIITSLCLASCEDNKFTSEQLKDYKNYQKEIGKISEFVVHLDTNRVVPDSIRQLYKDVQKMDFPALVDHYKVEKNQIDEFLESIRYWSILQNYLTYSYERNERVEDYYKNYVDTVEHLVYLPRSFPKKVALLETTNAYMYFDFKLLKKDLLGKKHRWPDKNDSLLIMQFNEVKNDTMQINPIMDDLEYEIENQLMLGNVKVYSKKQKCFVPFISYQLERATENLTFRRFYLPNRTSFFSTYEMTMPYTLPNVVF